MCIKGGRSQGSRFEAGIQIFGIPGIWSKKRGRILAAGILEPRVICFTGRMKICCGTGFHRRDVTSFFFSILAFLAVGGWAQVVCGGGSGKNPLFLAAAMAFWGLCLFLMLWEAQDKQLYNHSTWLMLSLLYSLDAIGGLKRNARAGRGEDSGEKEDDKQLTA